MFRDLEIWLNHFEYHAQHPRCIPVGLSDVLEPEERRLIARSMAIFQLGEQSEGTALLVSAWRFAKKHRMFFASTAGIVYLTHRAVLRSAGYNMASFLRVCTTQYDFYLEAPVTCRESGPRPFRQA